MSAATARDLLELAWIVPALPLLGSVLLLFFGRRIGEPVAGFIATGLMVLAFIWSIVMFVAIRELPEHAQVSVHTLWSWLPAGTLEVNFGTYVDPLSVTWLLLVTGVGSLIHLYSIGYMHGDPRFSRFFCYLNLFAASMLILVLGSTFLLTFLGWEGVGLSSYLLVSFWYERNAAAVAGKKAFVTNRVGDVGFLIAMFLIFVSYGTLDYAAMPTGARLISSGTATAIALLLLLAACGKSAQIPLHVWLPDAMEGPTPVSALIHAATMVTAGVYLLCRAHVFLEQSGDAAIVVAWIGGVTALLAGTVAILQPDIKRVLAYSTVSQLGYMFLAVGVGAYTAAVFMVICHACYKGCLFLGAGSVIHGNHDIQDMRVMGRFRRFLPYTAMGMVVAWLAISGIPPLSGFFSKDEIITQVFLEKDYGLWVIALIAAIFTALYMTRLIFLTFYGNQRFELTARGEGAADALPVVSGGSDDAVAVADTDADSDPSPTVAYGTPVRYSAHPQAPHESPGTMTGPILVLAFLAATIGFLNMPFDGLRFFDDWLEPSFPNVPENHPSSFFEGATLEVAAVILAIIGIAIAYRLYRKGLASPARDPLNEKLGPVAPVLGHAYWYDEGIAKLVDGPLRAFARFLDKVIDTKIIDGAVDGTGRLFKAMGRGLRHVQDGYVRRYALGIACGVAALLLYAVVWVGAVAVVDFPILSVIIGVPIAGSIICMLVPARRPEIAKAVGYATTMITFGFAAWMLWHFEPNTAKFQFLENEAWIPRIGVNYLVGVDGISVFMVAVTALLFPLGLLASERYITHRVKAYVAWFLLLEGAIMGIFLALDLIAFFVFWELMLVPMYFLILGWGSGQRAYAALKFFLYTAAGSAFLLASMIALAFIHQADTGVLTFDYRVLAEWNGLSGTTEVLLFLGFMAAFAIKAPLFPFHTWLPLVHTEAPTAGSVVLAGVILKMGAYGLLRFSFELFPQASVDLAPIFLTLAVIGIIYGAIVAAMQTDLKRVIAYSSVAHMGFVVLGIFSLTVIGIDGAVFTMLSHPLTTGALFLVVGMLYERRHTREISAFRGVWKPAPILTAMFLIALFAGIGLPGFSGFIGEFLALIGTFQVERTFAIIATTGVILAAVYMLWAFQRVFTGKPSGDNAKMRDASLREIVVVVPLLALSLFLGLYPKPALDRIEPSVRRAVADLERKSDYDEPEPPAIAKRVIGAGADVEDGSAAEREGRAGGGE